MTIVNEGQFKGLLQDAKTPADAISIIANAEGIPQPIVDMVQEKCLEMLVIELPAVARLAANGPVRTREQVAGGITALYQDALEGMRQERPDLDKMISATVKDVALDIAERIDAGVKRVLLDDKYVNAHAWANLQHAHARVVSCLEGIKLDQQQEEWCAENMGDDSA